MKSSKQNSSKAKNNFWYPIILLVVFSIFVFLNKQQLFEKFNPSVINNYLKSQDIFDEKDVIKDRVFISDSDIYIASGYLYANGEDPRNFNFQHPPSIKYLFGLSSKYFNMPLLPNIIFGALLIFEIYLLGKLVFKNELTGFLASILIIFDPVFKEVTTYALLDLGQMVFILGFIITIFYYKKHWIGQGVLLGLATASKFYSPAVIFLGFIYLYKFITKNINIKNEILMLSIALLIFCLNYFITFKNDGGLFNIFFHQAKIIKFMIEHNRAAEWGSVIKMFLGGYFLWPILFFINLYLLLKAKVKGIKFLIILIPITYLLIMCFQLPFTRYFILILPFLYLNVTSFAVSIIQSIKYKK